MTAIANLPPEIRMQIVQYLPFEAVKNLFESRLWESEAREVIESEQQIFLWQNDKDCVPNSKRISYATIRKNNNFATCTEFSQIKPVHLYMLCSIKMVECAINLGHIATAMADAVIYFWLQAPNLKELNIIQCNILLQRSSTALHRAKQIHMLNMSKNFGFIRHYPLSTFNYIFGECKKLIVSGKLPRKTNPNFPVTKWATEEIHLNGTISIGNIWVLIKNTSFSNVKCFKVTSSSLRNRDHKRIFRIIECFRTTLTALSVRVTTPHESDMYDIFVCKYFPNLEEFDHNVYTMDDYYKHYFPRLKFIPIVNQLRYDPDDSEESTYYSGSSQSYYRGKPGEELQSPVYWNSEDEDEKNDAKSAFENVDANSNYREVVFEQDDGYDADEESD